MSNVTDAGVVYWALNGFAVTAVYLVVNVILLVLAVWVILLNALVFDTLVRVKGRGPSGGGGGGGHREMADWLVSSLSLADLLTGLFIIYNTIYNLVNFQTRLECLIRNAFLIAALISSAFHLSLLTADRYIKIIFPYRYDTMCNGATVAACAVTTWVFSFLMASLPAMGWSNAGWNSSSTEPTAADQRDVSSLVCSFFGLMRRDFLTMVICLFFIPSLVMMLMYSHIFKVASRHAREIEVQKTGSKSTYRHALKYTKTVMIIVGLYFLVWLPEGIVLSLHIGGHLEQYSFSQKGVILIYTTCLPFVGSLLNPIIYSVKISSVRARFRLIFCRKQYARNQHETTVTTEV